MRKKTDYSGRGSCFVTQFVCHSAQQEQLIGTFIIHYCTRTSDLGNDKEAEEMSE